MWAGVVVGRRTRTDFAGAGGGGATLTVRAAGAVVVVPCLVVIVGGAAAWLLRLVILVIVVCLVDVEGVSLLWTRLGVVVSGEIWPGATRMHFTSKGNSWVQIILFLAC